MVAQFSVLSNQECGLKGDNSLHSQQCKDIQTTGAVNAKEKEGKKFHTFLHKNTWPGFVHRFSYRAVPFFSRLKNYITVEFL
jgi:hypothetical protein